MIVSKRSDDHGRLRAGFARVEITPPVGTPLMGWGEPWRRLAKGVHDPLYCRALYLAQGTDQVVILGLDLCFIGREDYDRVCGRLAREFGLMPRQILACASHTHAGPAVGTYYDLRWNPPPRSYVEALDDAVVQAVGLARSRPVEVRLRAKVGRTALPMNRRQSRGGRIVNGPNPAGPVYDALPVCLLEERETAEPVCLLFACSTHPVCFSGEHVSADYPGVAMDLLDRHLGRPCSLFLQGMAGDSRPVVLADGSRWKSGPGPDETRQAGEMLAAEALALVSRLEEVEPGPLASAQIETRWPLQRAFGKEDYRAIAEAAGAEVKARWANDQIQRLERGRDLSAASILMHGVRVGERVRILAIEGEPLHPYGFMIEETVRRSASQDAPVTFAVGYANGEGMYLVTTPMLAEGGYEPESYWEYHQAAPLAPGMEEVARRGLAALCRQIG